MWALRIVSCLAAIVEPQLVVGEQRTPGTSVVRTKDKNPTSGQESFAEVSDASHAIANTSDGITPYVSTGHWEEGGEYGVTTKMQCNNEKPQPRRNRHKMCFSSECGPPPTAFMVAWAHGGTQLESFASASEVLWDSWWASHVTRTQINNHMTSTKENCNCEEGCDEWNAWALNELSTPAHCKFPGHEWRLLWADMGPPVEDYAFTAITEEGQSWANPNHLMREIGLDARTAYEGFHNGATYKFVAQKQPKSVWHKAHAVNHNTTVRKGHKIAVWQFILTCKVFNSHNMYINEAHFGTNVKVTTSSTQRPTCNPNVDSCGVKVGHHC